MLARLAGALALAAGCRESRAPVTFGVAFPARNISVPMDSTTP